MIERIGIVFGKEVRDNLRDGKTLGGALVSGLLGPVMILLLIVVMGRAASEQAERPLSLPVVGAENAPQLIEYLTQRDVLVLPPPDDPEGEVRAGNLDVVLIVPAGFAEEYAAGVPATVRLVVDESRQSATVSVRRARSLLASYNQMMGALRLLARGVSPTVLEALAVENVDVSTPQSHAATVLSIAPFFIIFAVFLGGMYLAIDTTSGERERGSLEPLLICPATRRDLVLGKLLATLLFTMLAVVVTLAGFGVGLNFIPLEKYVGVRFGLGLPALVNIFLLTLPMMLLAAALQMIIATLTRSFKEAQNYLGFLPLVPGLPGMFIGLLGVRPDAWTMLIPTFGQQVLINQVMRGEALSLANAALSAGVTIAVGAVLLVVVIRLYESERILFGR